MTPTPSSNDIPALSALPPAGLLRRLAATLYDLLILLAVWFLVAFAYVGLVLHGKAPEHAQTLQWGLFPLLVSSTVGFYGWFWIHGGQTLGMRAWRLKVVDARLGGHPLTWTQCLLRCVVGLLSWSAFGAGYLWLYTDSSRDTWHDRMSGTRTLVIPKSMM